jgi:hypothetical protein
LLWIELVGLVVEVAAVDGQLHAPARYHVVFFFGFGRYYVTKLVHEVIEHAHYRKANGRRRMSYAFARTFALISVNLNPQSYLCEPIFKPDAFQSELRKKIN